MFDLFNTASDSYDVYFPIHWRMQSLFHYYLQYGDCPPTIVLKLYLTIKKKKSNLNKTYEFVELQ